MATGNWDKLTEENKAEIISLYQGGLSSIKIAQKFKVRQIKVSELLRSKGLDVSRKQTLIQFIEKARKVHGDRYNYSKVDYKLAKEKVEIICSEHGSFFQAPTTHISAKCGCPNCGNLQRASLLAISQEEFLQKCADKHGDKYDYSASRYKNQKEKVVIICPSHGEFLQTPDHHLSGNECPKCSQEKMKGTYFGDKRLTIQDFVNQSNKVHKDKYNYSPSIYTNKMTKLRISCPIHGIFEQTPNSHIQGSGCPSCSRENVNNSKRLEFDVFVSRSIETHGDLYNYSITDYRGLMIPIQIICETHGIFESLPINHLNGQGCLQCYDSTKSLGEIRLASVLESEGVEYQFQKTFEDCRNPKTNRKLSFDFYLPQSNTLIEYDGKQHFEPVKHWGGKDAFDLTVERDIIKNRYSEANKIPLLRIPYNEDIREKLTEFGIIPAQVIQYA